MGHPVKSSLGQQEPPGSTRRLGGAWLSHTQGWVLGEIPEGWEQQGGTLCPQPQEGPGRGGDSSRSGSTPRLCPGKDTVARTSREGD